MDPRRFDEFARRLAQTLPRRILVKGSVGAWLLATFQGHEDAAGKPGRRAKACIRNGQKCGKEKPLQPCSKCCSGFSITTRSGKKKCACRPDGAKCTRNAQCCAAVCFDRHCGATS